MRVSTLMLAPLVLAIPFLLVVDLILLVVVGRWLGVGPTFLLVVGTGLLGWVLARWQGVRALARAQEELAEGRLPGAALLDGLALLVAAILLLAPGPITDTVGLLLLIPPLRRGARRLLVRHLERMAATGTLRVGVMRPMDFGDSPFAPRPPADAAHDHSAARAAGLDPRNEVRSTSKVPRGDEPSGGDEGRAREVDRGA